MKTIIPKLSKSLKQPLLSSHGNILVYIVLTMVIFGVLGVTMVSLFSTSISSSATQNDTRRATYLSEAGTRYAMSEMLNGGFSKTIINDLNATEYTINPSGRFWINIFSPWFEPDSNLDLNSQFTDQTRSFDVQEGELPTGFVDLLPTSSSGVMLVNYDYIDLNSAYNNNPPPSARAIVTGGIEVVGNPLKLQLTLEDDTDEGGFVANHDETVSFAVQLFADPPNTSFPVNILLQPAAARIFPARNGAIEIKRRKFYYEQAIDQTTYVELTNVRPVKGENTAPIVATAADDFVILSSRNRFIISEGKSGEVYFGKHMNYASAVSNISTLPPESLKPDIEFDKEADLSTVLAPVEQTPSTVVDVYENPDNNYITLSTSGGTFGAFWFRDPSGRSIGGVKDFCNNLGGCFFNNGFRAFFVLNFSGSTDGDGLTFSIVNATNNEVDSIGGDIYLSELLAYAGDSRTTSNPSSASDFLDGRSGVGLNPPKFALEFDGFKNNQFATICEDSDTPHIGTRNDPNPLDSPSANRDMVHYVFWGSNNDLINALCRRNTVLTPNTERTYDDNRHDGVNTVWIYDSGSQLLSSPAIDNTDPTRIYTGRSTENSQINGGRLIRLRASDGTTNSPGWSVNPNAPPLPPSPPPLNDGDVNSSPELDNSGNIYIGNDDNLLAKFSSSGTPLSKIFLDGDIEGKPAVSDLTQTVYVATDNGSLYALNRSDLSLKWATPVDIGSASGTYSSSPVIRNTAPGENIVYVGSLNGILYAFLDNGSRPSSPHFTIPTGDSIRGAPAVNQDNGNIYFGSDDGQIRARTGEGGFRWSVSPAPSSAIVASPAPSPGEGRVYVGSTNGRLYALDDLNLGNEIWRYPDPARTPSDPTSIGAIHSDPVIASDGAIIFGSDDGHLYALNPNGTLRWKYPATGSPVGAIRSKPAIDSNGIIYFTANDGKLYAVDPAANDPPNIPNLFLTSAELGAPVGDVNNWFASGPWAVRVEVQRESIDSNADGKFTYTLKTWMKKCDNADCTNVVGTTFFQNTRFEYDWTTAGITPMTQVFELSNTPETFHTWFDRFRFGFTSASTASQTIEIRRFQLSFIRPNDPVVSD